MAARSLTLAALLPLLAAASSLRAQMSLTPSSSAIFATVQEAQSLLAERDDFVDRMSPFDRAARLQSADDVTVDEYLAHAKQNALAWPADEQAKVEAALAAISPKLAELDVPLPATVHLVHTTGREEGGAAYTRGATVVLPEPLLAVTAGDKLERLVAHELFHVLSRTQPELKQKLYAAIGFEPCGEVELPADYADRRITNPDGPHNDYCIKVEIDGASHWVVPILYSRTANYDASAGGGFFPYLQFRFLAIDRPIDNTADGPAKPTLEGGKPLLTEPLEAANFFEQVGRNTQYIIHPDEILADNFALLITGASANEPELLRTIETILRAHAATAR
jgi:hypothetical protein